MIRDPVGSAKAGLGLVGDVVDDPKVLKQLGTDAGKRLWREVQRSAATPASFDEDGDDASAPEPDRGPAGA